jgi:HPr kinase/phosphorylase
VENVAECMIHATAVSLNGYGVILTGVSGSGKSDLALRLIDRGAILIGDDSVVVRYGALPFLFPAPNIAGKIEVRGIGIMSRDFVQDIPLRMIVTLDKSIERLPNDWSFKTIAAFDLPGVDVNAFEASAPIKIELALKSIIEDAIMPVAIVPDSSYKAVI